MTEQLYYTDSYLKEFEAIVTALDEENHGVILDRTAFFPGGGGQPADFGQLVVDGQQEFVVKRAEKSKRTNGKLVHLIDDELLPTVGAVVTGRLDWEHRYKLMRTHTAMHIFCGVVWRDYQAYVTGGNMDVLQGRLDFEFDTMQQELVAVIEDRVNEEVLHNHGIKVAILPRDEAFQIPDLIRTKINLLPEGITEVRTVEIEGLDLQADGGTHVNSTSEVGKIRVVDYKSKGKINKRIYFELDGE